MKQKSKLGWLYLLIVLCVAFSGVMAWGLIDKLNKQKESADDYSALSKNAVVTGVTAFASQTVAPATAEPLTEAEAVDQSDTVFFINNNVVVVTATGEPTVTPSATAKPTAIPTLPATVTPTPAATAKPTASVTLKITVATPSASPAASATRPPAGSGWVVLTQTPNQTPTATARVATPTPSAVSATAARQTATPAPTAPAQPTYTAIPTVTPTVTPTTAPTPLPPTTQQPWHNRVVTMSDVHYSVDFGYLQGINEDVKAWLVQDGTAINYPVVQGKDNKVYLDRMFNGKLNKDGSIFMDSGSSAYFEDANTYIYGHHTKTDAMFSTLASYQNQAYYNAHPQLILLTPYNDYAIDLFAARVAAVDDETSWRIKQFARKSEFTSYIENLEANSLFKANPDSMPEWGDQLLVLVTCTNEQHGERYVVYGRMRQIAYASSESVAVTKISLDQAQTISGWREVPGRGLMMVYAQNDPLWNDMRYSSVQDPRKRIFGDGGCGPTSVAMAVTNLVPKDRLGDIYGYAKSSLGYTFCQCSVNQYFCNKLHAQYQIQSADEYLRYYPLVMASFATGNNLWGDVSRTKNAGTNLSFLKKIAYLYKLDLSVTTNNEEAFTAVQNGALAIASLGAGNPFTGGGHYAVVASVNDQYVYILDPYRQKNYDRTDSKHLLSSVAPGVVAVKRENAGDLSMSTFYILKATKATYSPDPPAVQ